MIDARRARLVRQRLRFSTLGTARGETPHRRPAPAKAAPERAVSAKTDDFRLAPLQERFWFHQRQSPRSTAFNICLAFELTSSHDRLRPGALNGAFAAIFDRQEVLRTRYTEQEGKAVGIVEQTAPTPGLVDLSRLGESALGEGALGEARRLTSRLDAEPFDLEAGPPLRAACLDLGDGPDGRRLAAVVVIHHVAWDGGSAEIFLREMGRALWIEPREVKTPRIRFADYAAGVRRRLDDGLRARQLAFWRRTLEGCPQPTALPFDRSRGLSGEAAQVDFRPDTQLLGALTALGRDAGATPFMCFLASFFVLLERLGAGDDIPVGVPVHARTSPQLKDTIGCFVNTLVLRGRPNPQATFIDLLEKVRRSTVDALDHADLPFEEIVRGLASRRQPGVHPLCQVFFSHQTAPRVALAGVDIKPLERGAKPSAAAPAAAAFDLSLALVEGHDDGPTGHLVFKTALFDTTTAGRITDHFQVLLHGLVSGSCRALNELPIFSGPQYRQVVDEHPARSLDQRQVAVEKRIARLSEEQRRLFEGRLSGALKRTNRTGTGLGQADKMGQSTTLVALRSGDEDLHPLVAFHPVGGSVYCHREWVAALEGGRTVLGLQAPGLDTDEPPLTEMHLLAARHAETLTPHGGLPPILVGWSFGGLLALETAHASTERGQAPALVVLLDAWPPDAEDRAEDQHEDRTTRGKAGGEMTRLLAFAQELAELEGHPFDSDSLRAHAASAADLLAALFDAAGQAGWIGADMDRPTFDRLARVHDASLRAMAGWSPRSWDGPTVLIQAGDYPAERLRRGEETWRRLCRNLEIVTAPGDHAGMLRGPGAVAIARQLETAARRLGSTQVSA